MTYGFRGAAGSADSSFQLTRIVVAWQYTLMHRTSFRQVRIASHAAAGEDPAATSGVSTHLPANAGLVKTQVAFRADGGVWDPPPVAAMSRRDAAINLFMDRSSTAEPRSARLVTAACPLAA
jgi:hypothetical protein